MTTIESRKINILCINVNIMTLFYVSILSSTTFGVTRENHLNDRIILLKREVSAHKTGLTPLLFTEMYVRSCIYVLGVSVFLLSIGNVFTVWYLFRCITQYTLNNNDRENTYTMSVHNNMNLWQTWNLFKIFSYFCV